MSFDHCDPIIFDFVCFGSTVIQSHRDPIPARRNLIPPRSYRGSRLFNSKHSLLCRHRGREEATHPQGWQQRRGSARHFWRHGEVAWWCPDLRPVMWASHVTQMLGSGRRRRGRGLLIDSLVSCTRAVAPPSCSQRQHGCSAFSRGRSSCC